jgi:hypothetical protein
MTRTTVTIPKALLSLVALLGLLSGLLLAAAPARAEDDDATVRKKIQEQIQKILRLMKENETALLRVSTGASGEPTKPKIDLPAEGQPPTEGQPQGTVPPDERTPEEKARDDEARRAELVRRIKSLLQGQREASREIPDELAQLVRLIPRRESNDPQDQPPQGQQPRPEDQEARDARKRLEESQKQQSEKPEQGGKDPQSPRDPNDPTRSDPNESPGGASGSPTAPWLTALPAEIRDAFANGDFGSVPAPYRDLVRRYLTWLNRQASARDRR